MYMDRKKLEQAAWERMGQTGAASKKVQDLDDRALIRAGLTDLEELSAPEWHDLAGRALVAWNEDEAPAYVDTWLEGRLPGFSREVRQGIISFLLENSTSPAEAHQTLSSVPKASLAKAVEWLEGEEPTLQGALAMRAAGALRNRLGDWIARYQSLAEGGSAHDGSYWLPASGTDAKTLARFLTEVDLSGTGKASLDRLRNLVSSWETIEAQVAGAYAQGITPTLAGVTTWKKAAGAPLCGTGQAARTWIEADAGGWGKYSEAAALIWESTRIPRAPLPRTLYEHDGYTGAFLDRNDPTGIVLGDLTDCCQHIGGAGQWCVEHGQANPLGGFFAVKDRRGIVVAQSWVWVNKNGVCFDNIEMLEDSDADETGMDIYHARRQRTAAIYEQAGKDLAARFGKATVGVGYLDKWLGKRWESAAKDSLSIRDLAYTDARTQLLIAKEEKPATAGMAKTCWKAKGSCSG